MFNDQAITSDKAWAVAADIGRGLTLTGGGFTARAVAKGVGKAASRVVNTSRKTAQLSKSQLKGIRSLEKQIQKHQKKLDEFKANLTVRPGMENLPKEMIRKQQQIRIKHLETEIKNFKKNIERIKKGNL